MTEPLRQIAEKDTPNGVDIPPGAKYLILWAVGRWGGGIVIALFFAFAWNREDTRSALREDALLEAYRQQSKNSSLTTHALQAHTESIKGLTESNRELTRAAERAHR